MILNLFTCRPRYRAYSLSFSLTQQELWLLIFALNTYLTHILSSGQSPGICSPTDWQHVFSKLLRDCELNVLHRKSVFFWECLVLNRKKKTICSFCSSGELSRYLNMHQTETWYETTKNLCQILHLSDVGAKGLQHHSHVKFSTAVLMMNDVLRLFTHEVFPGLSPKWIFVFYVSHWEYHSCKSNLFHEFSNQRSTC